MATLKERIGRLRYQRRRILWGEAGAPGGNPVQRAVRVLLLTSDSFYSNRLAIHASGLSFYLTLTVVPFVAFLFVLLRNFGVSESLRPYLLSFVAGGNEALVPRLEEYVLNAQSSLVGGLGTTLTLVLGFLLLQRVKATLDMIWGVSETPGYRYRLIEFLAVMTVTPVLMSVAFGVSGFLASSMVQTYIPQWLLPARPILELANVTSFAIVLMVTYYAYRFLPDTEVDWRGALVGALVGGMGLVLVQRFYVVLMVIVARQNLIYGALALLPFLMIWFHVAWMIFLFGAQMSSVVQHYDSELERRRSGTSVLSNPYYLVLLVLSTLIRLISKTGKSVHSQSLARRLQLPRDVVYDVLKMLTRARLITPVNTEPNRFVPQENLERLTVLDVLERTDLLPGFPGMPIWPGERAGHPLLSLFREANRNLGTPLAGVTMQTLSERIEQMGATNAPEEEDEEQAAS